MDQVLAIFAVEAGLNSTTITGSYVGLFQIARSPLSGTINFAKKHNISGIDPNMTWEKFGNLSGVKQLDYLFTYISCCKKDYSNIPANETITPAQMWAMIKLPSTGKDRDKVETKQRIINKTIQYANSVKPLNN